MSKFIWNKEKKAFKIVEDDGYVYEVQKDFEIEVSIRSVKK